MQHTIYFDLSPDQRKELSAIKTEERSLAARRANLCNKAYDHADLKTIKRIVGSGSQRHNVELDEVNYRFKATFATFSKEEPKPAPAAPIKPAAPRIPLAHIDPKVFNTLTNSKALDDDQKKRLLEVYIGGDAAAYVMGEKT